jgi:hypothetical protein
LHKAEKEAALIALTGCEAFWSYPLRTGVQKRLGTQKVKVVLSGRSAQQMLGTSFFFSFSGSAVAERVVT